MQPRRIEEGDRLATVLPIARIGVYWGKYSPIQAMPRATIYAVQGCVSITAATREEAALRFHRLGLDVAESDIQFDPRPQRAIAPKISRYERRDLAFSPDQVAEMRRLHREGWCLRKLVEQFGGCKESARRAVGAIGLYGKGSYSRNFATDY